MAQTDVSATAAPKVLISIAAGLLVARVIACIIGVTAPPPDAKAIAWTDPTSYKILPPPEEKKLIIYEFYAQWSDPCKRMEATALSNKQVSDVVSRDFVPIRITDVSHEKGKNPPWVQELQKRYRIFALPTLVVVDNRGENVGSLIGNCSSLTTYRFLSRSLHNRDVKDAEARKAAAVPQPTVHLRSLAAQS